MKIFEIIKFSLQSLASNKIRTTLTMLGIIIGISSVIIISMVGEGSQQSITGELMEMSDRTISIKVEPNDEILNKRDYITKDDLDGIKDIQNVTGVSPSMQTRASMYLKDSERAFGVLSVSTEEFESISGVDMIYGRAFTEKEIKQSKRVVLIDDIYAMRKFNKIDVAGEEIEIDLRRGIKLNLLIVGVYEHPMKTLMNSMGNEYYQPFIPYTTFNKYVSDQLISYITVSIDDINLKDDTTKKLVQYLENVHNKEGIYEVNSRNSGLESFNSILTTLSLMLTAVAGISLLVGGIGVMNIMLVSVTERIREIGIRKALGARKIDILLQFLIESLILALLGGTIGLLLGIGVSNIIGNFIKIEPILKYEMVILAVAVSSGIGIIFGTYPAKKASELNPIEALRHE